MFALRFVLSLLLLAASLAYGQQQIRPTQIKGVSSDTNSGTGALCLTTSCTMVTPALGTPSALVGTNVTGTATGFTAGKASNLTGGSGGTIPYQSAAATTAMLANGTAGQCLQSQGTTLSPVWGACGGGSGTVNSGTINQIGYYAAGGTAISGETLLQAVNFPALTGGVISAGGSLTTTVITNANLTGPIISSGNATAVASQTGTGSTFVMDTSPTIVTPVINSAAHVGGSWVNDATWTLPALTLGGTVSGGGHQINNVIVGNSTPLAGSFTTLSANSYNIQLGNGSTGGTYFADAAAGGRAIISAPDHIRFDIPNGMEIGRWTASGLRLTGSSSGFVGFSAAAAAGSTIYQLPSADGSSGQVLKTNGSAVLSWVTPAGGGNVSNSGSPTNGQIAQWTDATTIQGLSILTSANGGTGNGFTKFTGPTSSEKTFTLPDSSSTLLYSGGALGTPSSGTATNLSGTAAGLTAGTVTTNANLTGPITSSGNATTTVTGTQGFINSGALTCGAATNGEIKVHTTPLQYCDNAATPALQYAAYGSSTGVASSATVLATTRAIYGNNFDGSAALTQVIASTYGGTGNGFAKFSGPATSEKTFTLPNASSTLTITVASGAKALATGAISSAACTAAQTDTATGTLTTDAIIVSFNGDPTAVTGYVPLTSGMLTIIPYPTADTVNFKVCNNTSASITPGAVTLNWRVVR